MTITLFEMRLPTTGTRLAKKVKATMVTASGKGAPSTGNSTRT